MQRLLLIAYFLLFSFEAYSRTEEQKAAEPSPVGNFSVPSVSQVGPLISFGQLIIGKNALLPQLSGSYVRSHKGYENELAPNITYGIRDDLSVLFSVPFNLRTRSDASHSSGIEDIVLQLEYAFYSKSHPSWATQATIVGNVQFPTGSSTKEPPTGPGSFSHFLGTTYAFTSYNWYAFVSPGVQWTATHRGTQFGNEYLYQWGFGRYIAALSPSGWIFNLLIEFDGTYLEKDKIKGENDPDSGGNILFITPSIWLSSNRWILQWGIGFPIVQNLNGRQDKVVYAINYNLAVALQF